jgi:pimeloyl-ACP methyl ester carboxylesterase
MRLLRFLGTTFAALLLFAVVFAATARGLAWYREANAASLIAPSGGRFVDVQGTRLFVQTVGEPTGPPVVYVHGTAAWSGFWTDAITAIGGRFHHVAVDMPPFGFSDHDPTANYSRSHQAMRLISLVESMRLDRPVLVGHSFGAGAVLEAAIRRPELFRGMVIVSGALGLSPDVPGPRREGLIAGVLARTDYLVEPAIALTVTNPALTQTLLARMLHRREAATERQADILRQPFLRRNTTAAYAKWLPSLLFDDPKAESHSALAVRRLQLPVAIIWGREDTVTPLAQAEYLASLLPRSGLTVIDGVGHIPHVEDPTAFAVLMRRKLEELLPPPRPAAASPSAARAPEAQPAPAAAPARAAPVRRATP